MLILGVAMALATFLENDYGTAAAQIWIYKSWWFELCMCLLAINFILNIKTYALHRKGKRAILLFHMAFVLMIIGAAISRHIGFEGTIHIREGEGKDFLLTEQKYLSGSWSSDGQTNEEFNYPLLLSAHAPQALSFTKGTGEEAVHMKILEYFEAPEVGIKPHPEGKQLLLFECSFPGEIKEVCLLEENTVQTVFGFPFSYHHFNTGIQFFRDGDILYLHSPIPLVRIHNQTGLQESFPAHTPMPFDTDYAYNIEKVSLRLLAHERGEKVFTEGEEKSHGKKLLLLQLKHQQETQICELWHDDHRLPELSTYNLGNIQFQLAYGSQKHKLPFELFLEDFILDTYPGSNSPASYKSILKVTSNSGIEQTEVSMNNVLNIDGYRIFQVSYDNDLNGTILSVNHDRWGSILTYMGYFFLGLGMFLSLFSSKSRFQILRKNLAALQNNKKSLCLFLLLTCSINITKAVENKTTTAWEHAASMSISEEHANYAGDFIIIQQPSGRLAPLQALNRSILRKLHQKESLGKLNANQVILGISTAPLLWADIPIIKEKNEELLKLLNSKDKYLSYHDLFDKDGIYIIHELLELAHQKKPAQRGRIDQAVIKLDEKVNVLYALLNGRFIRMFPNPNKLSRWEYFSNSIRPQLQGVDSLFVSRIPILYTQAVNQSLQEGQWNKAKEILDLIIQYQNKVAGHLLPSAKQLRWENNYHAWNIFQKLFPTYFSLGFLLLCCAFMYILSPRKIWKTASKILTIGVVLAFAIHSFALALRWYISGHAPWSNGYESMLSITWFTILAAILFSRKSGITIPLATIMSAFLLLAANFSWMDPQITPLVPVLRSHWLVIHVAVIIAGYAFLFMGAILGLFALILMVCKTQNNTSKVSRLIDEMTLINEMTLIIGIYLLTLGSFIGGIWANESWGRYWGWDAKETWSLISIFVYAIILHLRLIPAFRKQFLFNLLSILSFSAILMTYFGVNYYLSGLHTYAQGDSVALPDGVFWAIGLLSLLSLTAYLKEKKNTI